LKREREREEILFLFFLFDEHFRIFCLPFESIKVEVHFLFKSESTLVLFDSENKVGIFFLFCFYKKEKNKWNPFFVFFKGDKKSGFLPIFEMLSIEDQTIISRSIDSN